LSPEAAETLAAIVRTAYERFVEVEKKKGESQQN
jgi:hypothetical protein